MKKIIIAQIKTDLKDLSADLEAEMRAEDIMAQLDRINQKVEDYAKICEDELVEEK